MLSGLAVGFLQVPSLATIVVTHQYTFEDGTVGNTINPATDSVGSSNMSLQAGSPTYSATVQTVPPAVISSSVSALFDGGSQERLDTASGFLWGTATDNFGMEAWIRPASADGSHTAGGVQPILINGYNTGTQGIYQVGGEWQMLLDNTLYDFNASITGVNTWDHVAMVRNNGTATLYVNGAAAGSTNVAVTGVPNFHSFLGATSFNGNNGFFQGHVDTVRYFTFTGGQFAVSDLNYQAIPEPATFALGLIGAAVVLRLRGRRK